MKITRKIFWPHNVYLITTAMSFLAWVTPDFGVLRKGFDKPIDLVSVAGLWALVAIFVCYMALKIGFVIGGGQMEAASVNHEFFSNDFVYVMIIFVALLGDAYSVISIYRAGGMGIIFSSLTDGSANDLKKALYEDYSAGFATLRYTSILSGALLFARRLWGQRRFVLDVGAFSSLLICALISSRLSLVAACFGGGYLYLQVAKQVRVSFFKLACYAALAFFALSLLSWSRNKTFYSNQGMGFFSSGVSEIVTYLGTPFQGMLFSFIDPTESVKIDIYPKAGVEDSLTTNSAFIDLFSSYADMGFIVGVLALFLSGLAIGIFSRVKSGRYSIVCFPLSYGVAEFWRIFLFNQGILIYLVLITLLICIFFLKENQASPKIA